MPFPDGVYAISGSVTAHDCEEEPAPLANGFVGVFVDDDGSVRVPVVVASLDGNRLTTFQPLNVATNEAHSEGGIGCNDGTQSSTVTDVDVVDIADSGFGMNAHTEFTEGASCLPIPAAGCFVDESFTLELRVECRANEDPEEAVDGEWSCA